MSPWELAAAIGRQWKLVLATAVLAAVCGGLLADARARTYETSAQLLVSVDTGASSASEAYDGNVLAQLKARSYASLVMDRSVAAAVVERLGLDAPVPDVQSRIAASWVPDTNLITVRVVDASPRTARMVADAVAPAFAARVTQLEGVVPAGVPLARVDLAEPAALPTEPSGPGPVRSRLLAALAGAALGGAVAATRSRVAPRTHAPDEVAAWLDVPTLGSVRRSSSARRRPLLIGAGDATAFAEGLRVLRARIVLGARRGTPSTLVVTSAGPRDGRTTLACCLAQVLAEGGYRVLLVDADLRRPQALRYLGPPAESEAPLGLSDLLTGAARLDEALLRGPGLDALGPGRAAVSPADAFGRPAMADLVDELSQRYDHVVFDTPPLVVADALLLAGLVDEVVLVARWGTSRRSALEDCRQQLVDVGASLAGVVVNRRPAGLTLRRSRSGSRSRTTRRAESVVGQGGRRLISARRNAVAGEPGRDVTVTRGAT